MAALLEPQEWGCPQPGGGEKVFILSKFPAIAGREIIAKYPLSGMPKLGDYAVNEETMFKLMSFVAIPGANGEPIRLTTKELINNHCGDWETLARVEMEMLKRNCSFFGNGQASTFLQGIARQAQALLTKTLMDLSGQLSKAEKRPSKS